MAEIEHDSAQIFRRKGWQMINELKEKIKLATLGGKEIEKNILKLALSEIQAYQFRIGSIAADKIDGILRKMIQTNDDIMKLSKDDKQIEIWKQENSILDSLLPRLWTKEEILANLRPVVEQIKAAKSEGQAIGIAMKKLKEEKAPVNSSDVGDVIKSIRTAS